MDQKNQEILRSLLQKKIDDQVRFNIEQFLFDKQLAFVRDQARFSTAVCSVRAGKTTACAADLIDTALTMPGTTGLYITLARSSAKRIVWPEIHKIIRDFKTDATFNEVELAVKFANGSIIYCSGANTEAETAVETREFPVTAGNVIVFVPDTAGAAKVIAPDVSPDITTELIEPPI